MLEMKSVLLTAVVPALASLALLGGCGGGDSDLSGSPTTFTTVPATMGFTVKAIANAVNQPCGVGVVGDVYIYGGAPPYRIDNNFPTSISLNRTVVSDFGGSFTVSFVGGGCLDPGSVTVLDSLNRIVTVTLTNTIK